MCACKYMRMPARAPLNLSIDEDLSRAMRVHIAASERRRGAANLSQITEKLWLRFLREKKAILPARFHLKNGEEVSA